MMAVWAGIYFFNAAFLCILYVGAAAAEGRQLRPGDRAPGFVIYSDDREVKSSTFTGNVIIITYETKDTTQINKPFKDAVLSRYAKGKDGAEGIAIIPVINCFKYVWPIKGYCASQAQSNARRLGIALYIDRDGTMFSDFGMVDDASNVVIIDRNGIVRFSKAGRLSAQDITQALDLLDRLAQERVNSSPQTPASPQ